ncbi:outer membrane usher protein [Pseudomonas sp. P9_35]|uniref:outer membrane usher protein n=1 Tax=unclassified Pseudomonas TaxID=196821 RepID=UPI002A367B90|nr:MULTISPECIES: outer membrane usher protein [unclassified Pseudomonas]WPN65642.1 outer membrane usher protein [Pseudomonas sp. P9_32]WPN71393.1 outer membrane usher protein [Pseudomonas sp. P9_35]
MMFPVSGLSCFRLRPLVLPVMALLVGGSSVVCADNIEFNSDVLDLADRANFDLGQFARSGYIMPGTYVMTVHVNKQELPEQSIAFYPPEDDPDGSEACISPELVEQFGLKPDAKKQLVWWHQGECLFIGSLQGMSSRGELGSASLYVGIPQAFLEYTSDNWDPPSRWDEGISGVIFDYNLNAQTRHQQRQGGQANSLSGNGVVGANLGAWRLRADWQARYDDQAGSGSSPQKSLDWSRYYAYRAIPELGAKLTVGEDYLSTSLFDNFRFAGASLVSDDQMLPPNLRGYAPEVTGVAGSNATVTVSQQGRVLYETQVAAGPFRIQDINGAVSGELDVRVEEQDGSVQAFTINTANIPYLARPGSVRYKVSAGRPSDWQHQANGPVFGAGEFSWGVSNGWSLFGGGMAGGDYAAAAVGIGRDLMQFGAVSLDVTQSFATVPEEGRLSGRSYRLNYSKNFDEFDSQVTFAGYRFSDQDFMSMSEYLDAQTFGQRTQSSKEMYTATFNKQFRESGLSAYVNYTHQTYWGSPDSDRYNLTLSRYFDAGRFKNLSVSFTAYRSLYNNVTDDGMYLSLSMPWDGAGSISYNNSWNRNNTNHQVGYYNRLGDHDSYSLNVGQGSSGSTASGYLSHRGDVAQVNASASYQEGSYSSVGMSLQGGATVTAQGGALHRSGVQGGTRILLDTDGVPDIPVRGYGATSNTNRFGKAVVADVSSYYRNKVSIDLNALPDNAEATRSVAQATLTEGAIGYRRFDVVAGEKAMAVIRMADGTTPPFGATVLNSKKQEVGIVNDGGSIYLSGIKPNEQMTVTWNGSAQCVLALPKTLPNSDTDLLLPCRILAEGA